MSLVSQKKSIGSSLAKPGAMAMTLIKAPDENQLSVKTTHLTSAGSIMTSSQSSQQSRFRNEVACYKTNLIDTTSRDQATSASRLLEQLVSR
jgi:hypothetical protein